MSVKDTLLTSLIAAGSVPAFAAGLACNNGSIDALDGANLTIRQIETVPAGDDFAVDHCRLLGAAHAPGRKLLQQQHLILIAGFGKPNTGRL